MYVCIDIYSKKKKLNRIKLIFFNYIKKKIKEKKMNFKKI